MQKSTCLIILFSLAFESQLLFAQPYFPESNNNNWERRLPSAMGLNAEKLKNAIDFAIENEYSGEADLRLPILRAYQREPFHQIAGPTRDRGRPAGLILKNGYIVAEWGDLNRADMTFSVTKSYLSTLAGLALDAGLIGSADDPVANYVWDGTYDGEHNSQITWAQLLNQSSDWSGTLFGTPDWADRPPNEGNIDDWKYRKLNKPGTVFEYNDVRVNLLAYSLLQVWRKPLPQVLKAQVMDKIGASTTWRWYGYENSWVELDGAKMQSVSGGGHSGGGLFISTFDHARFGLLFQNNGAWKEEQILTPAWIEAATKPSAPNNSYGYLWWLNQGDRKWEGVPENIFYAAGFGGNFIVVDQKAGWVIVVRWIEPGQIGSFVKLVYEAAK